MAQASAFSAAVQAGGLQFTRAGCPGETGDCIGDVTVESLAQGDVWLMSASAKTCTLVRSGGHFSHMGVWRLCASLVQSQELAFPFC